MISTFAKCINHHGLRVKCCSPHDLLNIASGNNIYNNSRNSYFTQVRYWCPFQYAPPFSNQSAWQASVSFSINGDGKRQKGLKGVEAHSKVLCIKARHGRIPGDFLKPSLISQIDRNSRTISSTAMEKALTSTQN